MKYVDYNFYVTEYGGSLPESEFDKQVSKASAYVKHVTMGRISDAALARFGEEIKMATCAVLEVYHTTATGGELASQTVGPWTKVYKGSGKTTDDKLRDAVEPYLLVTGLMYRGAM